MASVFSPGCRAIFRRLARLSESAAAMATVRTTFAQPVVAPLNNQQFSIHKHVGQFLPGAGIGCLNAGADNIHFFGAFLLRHILKIYETDGLVFINSQNNGRCG